MIVSEECVKNAAIVGAVGEVHSQDSVQEVKPATQPVGEIRPVEVMLGLVLVEQEGFQVKVQ